MDLNLALLAIIVIVGYMVGATTGFGAAVITITLGVHLYSLDFLVPLVVILNLEISIYIVAKHYKPIDWRLLLRKIIPLVGLGLPLGIVLFNLVEADVLRLVLGVFVICFSVMELIMVLRMPPGQERKPLSAVPAALWLFMGGVVHGMYAAGGPLVVYYAGRNIPDKQVFRSTLTAMWLVMNAVLLVVHLSTGKITTETAWMSAVLLPPLAIGIASGEWLHFRIPERAFRILIYSILIAAGISILL